jgi:hypothetical protein
MTDGDPRRRLSDTNIENQSLRMTTWLDRPTPVPSSEPSNMYKQPEGDGMAVVLGILGFGVMLLLLPLILGHLR